MRKIVIEFELPEEYGADYANVCAELVVEDFFGQKVGLRVLSDSGVIQNAPDAGNSAAQTMD